MNNKRLDASLDVGLIRVLTSNDQYFVDTHGRLIMENYPGITVESICIPDQWEGIHDDETLAKALPKIVEAAQGFADKDMILVSCADDPAVDMIREEMPELPVAGGGETTVAMALRYSSRIGVIGITDRPPRAYLSNAEGKIALYEKINQVNSTLDLLSDEGKRGVLECARRIKEAGCGVIALACTGMSTIGIAGLIERETGLPVVDPVIAEGAFAYHELIRKKYRNTGD